MTSVTLVRRIAARPETVFAAISTAEGIAHWFGPDDGPVLIAEMDSRVGGRFRVRFRMLDDTEHECSGELLEIDPPVRLAMTWRWVGGNEADGESRISFDLREVGDGECELVFTHALLPDEKTAKEHEQGWNGSLDKLGRHLLSRKDSSHE